MAPKRETSLELVGRVTHLGNSVAIRFLDYLSTAKNPKHGVHLLATEFLDLSQLLWSIEAGLTEAARKRDAFPADVTQELDKQFHRINDEFIVVNQMMVKFVDNENKKSGIGRAFRFMHADSDVEKVRRTLAKSRDQLRMSSAMFRWSLGDAKADSAMGIGYTGLAAALDRMTPGRKETEPRAELPPLPPPPQHSLMHPDPLSKHPPLPIYSSQGPQLADRAPISSPVHSQYDRSIERTPTQSERRLAAPLRDRPSAPEFQRHEHGLSPGIVDLHNNWRAPSVRSEGAHSIRDSVSHSSAYHHDSGYSGENSPGDSNTTSRTFVDDELERLAIQDAYTVETGYRTKSDPSWSPRQQTSSIPASGKGALVDAIHQRRHGMLEQLLEGGARADAKVEAAMLKIAAQNRDLESVALLLRYGIDANGVDDQNCSPLYNFTQLALFEGVKMLLKAGANPNASTGPNSETPFCLAACENRMELVKLYLTNGADANIIMENDNTPLIQCVNKTVSPKLVEHLLKSGAKANNKNGEGGTALFAAILANRIDIMTVLLDNGADPNLPGPKHPLWPSTYKPPALQLLLARGADHKKAPGIMELASSLKKLESIKILIGAGLTPNVHKDGVYTPLCSAIRDNSAEIVTYLLENGADPNLKASEYPAFKCITHNRTQFLPQLVAAGADLHTPKGIIECAIAHNNKDILTYLFDQGVNPNDRTPEGNTALTTAIRDNRVEMVDLLLAKGANPTIRGAEWPLCMAVKRPVILKKLLAATPNPRAFRGIIEMAVVANQLDSIKMLLAAGVSVEDKNCGVFSPLTTAIRERHKPIVRFLLDEADADPNQPGEHLPLVKALRRLVPGDTEILQMLLTRGADINKMHRGWNAVLQAVENGDADILKLLIEKGNPVDLQAVDESGRLVVDIVEERGWEEGLTILQFPNPRKSR